MKNRQLKNILNMRDAIQQKLANCNKFSEKSGNLIINEIPNRE